MRSYYVSNKILAQVTHILNHAKEKVDGVSFNRWREGSCRWIFLFSPCFQNF